MAWPAAGTAIVTGWLVTSPSRTGSVSGPDRLLALAIAAFVGTACHSLWRLVWLGVSGGSTSFSGYIAFDLALPVLLLVLQPWRFRRPDNGGVRPDATSWEQHRGWAFTGLAVVAVGVGATSLVALEQPHGAWDAWAVWNFKARWLALAGADWRSLLTEPAFLSSHPDYPLFVPLSISRLWALTGATPTVVPQVFGTLSASCILLVMFAATWRLRGPLAAIVGVSALLALPSMLVTAASQYADVPLACAYLVTFVALACAVDGRRSSAWFIVAGLAAGTAMWTKNEGGVFAGCALISVAALTLLSRAGLPTTIRRLVLMAVGLAPFMAAALFIKASTPVNLIVSTQSSSLMVARLLDLSRHREILTYSLRMFGSLMDPTVLVLAAVALVRFGRAASLQASAIAALAITLTALGYYTVFLLTPYPLDWHLRTAADRLLIQLWPSIVLAVVLASAGHSLRPAEPARSASALPGPDRSSR